MLSVVQCYLVKLQYYRIFYLAGQHKSFYISGRLLEEAVVVMQDAALHYTTLN